MAVHKEKHECPHPLCTVLIPNAQMACNKHWLALPMGTRITLYHDGGTAALTSVRRRNAVRAAMLHWRIDMDKEAHAQG
jgi:hypothetical protein